MSKRLTKTEKAFKTRMTKLGWYTYRDEGTGRLVTNCYREEINTLSEQLAMQLEVVVDALAPMVKVAAVELHCTATN